MDARAARLVKKYKITSDQAQALVEAGLGLPRDIKKTSRGDLEKVAGIGAAAAGKLKG